MGRPKGSKNKSKNNDLKLDGGEWLQRNIEKPDISGMPQLQEIKIPSKNNPLTTEELREWIREESIAYMIELFPANRIKDDNIREMWQECQSKLIKLKRVIFDE